MKKNGKVKKMASLFLLFFLLGTLEAQVVRNKNFNEQFSGKRIVEVNHRYGDLDVQVSDDNTVRANINFMVEAKTSEDVETIINNLEMEFYEKGDQLTINTKFETENWNTINGKTSIHFKNGTRVKGIKVIKIHFTLFVPKLEELRLSSKYDNIIIHDNIDTQLKVRLHSCKLRAGTINGNMFLEGKYGKMTLGDVTGNLDLNLYDTNIEMGSAKKVNLKSKYSNIKMGDIAGLVHESHDDNVSIKNNNGELVLTSKYSEYEIGGATKANIKSYDDDIEMGDIQGELVLESQYSVIRMATFANARIDSKDDVFIARGNEKGHLMLKSKYSEFKIASLNSIAFESSYDDKIKIGQLGSLKGNSKYSEFVIDRLEASIDVYSYDDHLTVEQVAPSFKSVNFGGKYSTLELKMPPNMKYQLDARMTYGRILYPKQDFELETHIEEGSVIDLKGKIKGALDTSPKITIENAYDCHINLKA